MQGLVIAALLLAPPPADEFCRALKKVVASIPGDFAALGLRERVPDSGVFDVDAALPGDFECRMDSDKKPGVIELDYSCTARTASPVISGDQRVLAGRVSQCLGVVLTEQKGILDDDALFFGGVPGGTLTVSYLNSFNSAMPINGGGSFFYARIDIRAERPQ